MPLLRRDMLVAMGGALAAASGAGPVMAQGGTAQDGSTAYGFAFDRAGGGPRMALSNYRDRPILIVNTATQCGFAGQFATLEQLWQRYRERGLMLIAVPSNDFGGQEPLDGAAIVEAVRASHGATYAFAEKAPVRGPQAHPFYRWAASQRPTEVPRWNFHKYLVGRDGRLVGGFGSMVDPIGSELVQAIGREVRAA